jgi:molybdenum cofactor cytidylyltransferase
MLSIAIVPAAGRSDRFGSPKLTADLRGEPLLERTIRSLLEGHAARVVVVASAAGVFERVPLVHDPRVSVVVNPDPDRGMLSSIQAGLEAADGDPILILPGDMPFVRPATVAAVLEAYRRAPGFIVVHRARAAFAPRAPNRPARFSAVRGAGGVARDLVECADQVAAPGPPRASG